MIKRYAAGEFETRQVNDMTTYSYIRQIGKDIFQLFFLVDEGYPKLVCRN